MQIRVTVCGAAGRMGGEVASLVSTQKDMTLNAAVDVPGHDAIGQAIGPVTITADLHGAIETADVVVDFSSPLGALQVADQ